MHRDKFPFDRFIDNKFTKKYRIRMNFLQKYLLCDKNNY